MDNRYKLLIFDWDGTLMDSEATIISCMQVAIAEENIEPRSEEEIRNTIGLGLQEAMQHLYPTADEVLVDTLVTRYRATFFLDVMPQNQLFSGVYETIEQLYEAGFLLAIATGKSRRGLNKELAQTNLEEFFPISRTAEETFSKPHPRMLDEIVVDCSVEIEQALMIGDSEYDLQMANNLGMDSLAVACGVHSRERLFEQNPVGFLATVTELPDWLNSEVLTD